MKMTRRMLSMLSAIKLAVTPKHGTEWMTKEALQEFCDSRGWIVDFMDSERDCVLLEQGEVRKMVYQRTFPQS